jgi:predicted nuclease of restriction endonuclease-like (RecB) superfamily
MTKPKTSRAAAVEPERASRGRKREGVPLPAAPDAAGPGVGLYDRVRDILVEARTTAVRAVNHAMTLAYFEIGRLIVEDEQRGEARADYGAQVIALLAARLTAEFGRGFSYQNLMNMKQFYQRFQILQTVSRELGEAGQTLSSRLSWSHYTLLMRLDDDRALGFYMAEAIAGNWSVRELDRQIDAMLFERLVLAGGDREKLAVAGHVPETPRDLVKDPYVFEFLGIPQPAGLSERQLETALIDNLQAFLLELGRGFTFVGRQQRLTLDAEHFFVDLVFYNRLLRCFVLIDLKIGKLTHQALGQMQMYVHYYDREVKTADEAPTVGVVLCRDKKETIVRYTLPEDNRQVFAAKYRLYLPTEEELTRELDGAVREIREAAAEYRVGRRTSREGRGE